MTTIIKSILFGIIKTCMIHTKLLCNGWIQPITSLFVLLLKKKDDTWCMCVNYHALNALITWDCFPLPMVDKLLDELGHKCVFAKLDLTFGFHQICLQPQDNPKQLFTLMVDITSIMWCRLTSVMLRQHFEPLWMTFFALCCAKRWLHFLMIFWSIVLTMIFTYPISLKFLKVWLIISFFLLNLRNVCSISLSCLLRPCHFLRV